MNDSPPPNPKRRWYQHGLRAFLVAVLVLEGLAVLLGCFLVLAEMSYTRWWRIAGLGLVGMAVIVVMILAIVRLVRHRFRYSLRTLFVFMVLCAIACSWLAVKLQRFRKQDEVVKAIIEAAEMVDIQYEQYERIARPGSTPERVGSAWMRKLLGDDYLAKRKWTNLKRLHVTGTGVTDASLKHLKALTKLEALGLTGTQVTDDGQEHLKVLTKLEVLGLAGTQITDAGLEHLRGLRNLRYLYLNNCTF